MKNNAGQKFSSDAEGCVSGADAVGQSPCTTGRSAAKAGPGNPGTSSRYAAMEQLAATAGLKLTPWQLTLLVGMSDPGKTRAVCAPPQYGRRGFETDLMILDELLTSRNASCIHPPSHLILSTSSRKIGSTSDPE
ncbi:hypothetical protein PEGLEG_65 [Mycobacterium phage PegLeg]|uniref:Uncharacterized protein n=1 Tax=Mycobacterium phage PegLeg TaxID=1325953 RepID=R4TQ43_9CAUD|nr:hypothetical protein PEGLEG_65 [Mycobacterium phage PegLeg]AGM12388.1 hypothetical protein PEGLEG_65 [Mycobacterium phage PegLeg]